MRRRQREKSSDQPQSAHSAHISQAAASIALAAFGSIPEDAAPGEGTLSMSPGLPVFLS
jgi:hypothetical protein